MNCKEFELALQTSEDGVLCTPEMEAHCRNCVACSELLEDMNRIHDAIEAYKRASSFADAHYNLSRLYELVGEHNEALKHLKTYRSLIDPP